MSPHPVLIAGGGIGGLTAAVALRRAGFAVRVFERAPELHEVGAGLTIEARTERAPAYWKARVRPGSPSPPISEPMVVRDGESESGAQGEAMGNRSQLKTAAFTGPPSNSSATGNEC